MTGQVEQFADLWGPQHEKYAIVQTVRNATDLRSCVIFNTVARTAELIEDDDLAIEVMRRMVAAGVPIMDRIPDHGV